MFVGLYAFIVGGISELELKNVQLKDVQNAINLKFYKSSLFSAGFLFCPKQDVKRLLTTLAWEYDHSLVRRLEQADELNSWI